MGWHQRIAPALRRIGVAAMAVVALVPGVGRAQPQYDFFGSGALAIAAYEASKDQCIYSDKMAKALADIDALLGRQDAYRWEETKRLGPDGLTGPRNMARLQGVSDCKVYGLLIGNAVMVYFNAPDFDQTVFAEFNRLQKGEGRSISGKAEARPPQPPPPGSAADTITRLNGGRGFDNTPAAQPPQSSTLKRPPVDDPPPESSRSQPPPRQPAEPSPRRGRTPPAPLAQAPPSVSPNLAPNAVAKPTLPAASSSSDCRVVAGDCRLAQATFACNLDDAARIAGDGPDAGWQAGLAAVRADTCEIVAAGRTLKIEATKTPTVVYATEQGRHVGYLPVGVFAPADQAGTTACRVPGFCAVRRGPPIWLCRQADSLALPTTEVKRAAGCLQIADSAALEVATAQGDAVALLNMVGGSPVVPTLYYAARRDFVGLDLTPTPASRGWCRPGNWCVIPMGSVFCPDRLAYERIMSQTGDARRAAILAEPACRLLVPGNVLKPGGVPAADDPRKLIAVEHPVLKAGWASANAFKVVALAPPLRFTMQLSDLAVSITHGASQVAVALKGQGTEAAMATFRSGAKERLAFCAEYEGEENVEGFRSCYDQPDRTITLQANCYAKRLAFDGRTYQLRERPAETPRWQFLDLSQNLWADSLPGSTEPIIRTGFSALCPGANPDAGQEIAFRDSRAAFPQELRGRWFADRRACADPSRHQDNYEGYAWMEFGPQTRTGAYEYEFPQRINAVRAVGRGAWEIDGSHRIDDATVPEIFQSSSYRLTRDRLALRQHGRVSDWVRCR
nr:hypothetical protein [Methylobacterium sp. L1A1]